MATVSLDPIASVLRYHPCGGFGDPFTFSCVMTRYGDEVMLSAASGEFTADVSRRIKATLKALGVKTIRYQRRKRGMTITL